ncbi:MAG TPA: hypothetical protein VI233_11695 [Puia sp.]
MKKVVLLIVILIGLTTMSMAQTHHPVKHRRHVVHHKKHVKHHRAVHHKPVHH